MKKLLVFILIIGSNAILQSQILNGRFSTSFYSFEKFDTIGASNLILRAFQTLQLDVTKDQYSFHSLLQGNTNISGDVYEASPIKFYNIYFKVRKIFNFADLSLGRHSVFAGVGNGLIDGATIRLAFFQNKLILKTFGGADADYKLKPEFTKNLKDNYIIGFQLIGNPIEDLSIGVSYVDHHKERLSYIIPRPDSSGLVYYPEISYNSNMEQLASTDINFEYPSYFRIQARYDYDLNLEQSSRIQFGTKIYLLKNISIIGDYIQRTPRLYYNSIFQVFDSQNNEEIETGLEYVFNQKIRFFGKFANVQYSGDKTNRFTFGMNTNYGSLVYSGSNGYAGELSNVSAQLFYPMHNRKIIPMISVSRASYKLQKNGNRYESFVGVIGISTQLVKYLSLDAQINWISNRIYKDDLRLLLKANYFFSQRLNIF